MKNENKYDVIAFRELGTHAFLALGNVTFQEYVVYRNRNKSYVLKFIHHPLGKKYLKAIKNYEAN